MVVKRCRRLVPTSSTYRSVDVFSFTDIRQRDSSCCLDRRCSTANPAITGTAVLELERDIFALCATGWLARTGIFRQEAAQAIRA
jgi:hypothetical protein